MAKMLRFKELQRRISVGRTTIWRWERENMFPKRRILGRNVVAWSEEEVERWIAEKQASRADANG